MLRMERSRRVLPLILLLSTLSAPLAAQGTSRADLAGWLDGVWSRWMAPLSVLWNDGRGACDPDGGPCWNDGRGGCDPNGGPCGESPASEPLPEGRGGCDPDGGPCGPAS